MNRRDPHLEEKLWRRTLGAVQGELAALPAAERGWLQAHLAALGALQERLHQLFLDAGGPALCRNCDGACCGCGRNHLTLGNLAALLLRDREPPAPDWTAPCPWLGPAGCRLAAAQRPFNCVSFVCEAVEARLGAAGCAAFYALERELRAAYAQLAGRYAGAGLQGLLLRAERLGARGFFARP